MAKKQQRHTLADIIRQKSRWENEPIQLIMKNKAVHFGHIAKLKKDKITFINMMRHRLSLDLREVLEGWTDERV